jgi:hypothetical protein
MWIKYALLRRNDIVFIHVVLGQTKMASANMVETQILRAVKRIEALKMNKYLHPGHFCLGSHRSTHDSGVQRASCSSFKTFVRSPRGSRPNARMPTTSERAYDTPFKETYVTQVSVTY